MPDTVREWSLASPHRAGAKRTPVAQCPTCYADALARRALRRNAATTTRPAREAAERRAVERREGELAMMTLEDRRLDHLRTTPLRDLLKGARTHDDLEQIADARGFHRGWVEHRHEVPASADRSPARPRRTSPQ